MSVASIASSALLHYSGQTMQSNRQKFQQSIQQLGQDLQSGNLSAAQSDFATLQQMAPQIGSTTSSQSSNSLAQEFNQLGTDLQAGNTTAAQQDFQQIQQQVSPTAAGAAHHHHHHGGGGGGNDLNQILQQLGQQLQAGNLSGAQQAYTVLQQQLESLGQTGQTSSSTSGNVAVSA
jgi:outer membrane protein assembly factor BamD (BamD/ComL family)